MTTAKTTLDQLKARLAEINEDLLNIPAFKLGTAWHIDRCREVRALARRVEDMTARAERPSN